MSGHRITAIIALVLCATPALADNEIDLSLYADRWPKNYFQLSDPEVFDRSNYRLDSLPPSDRRDCLWSQNALSTSHSRYVAGADDDTMSNMWLRSDDEFDGDYQMMLCGNQEFSQDILIETEPDVWNALPTVMNADNMSAKKISICNDGKFMNVNRPQKHLGDDTGRKHWECVCDSDTCRWREAIPEMRCERYEIFFDPSKETRKYLLQVDSDTVVMCGVHNNSDNIGSFDITPRSISYAESACAQGVEWATTYSNPHLGDTTGNKLWRCECRDNNCEWKKQADIKTCSVDDIPNRDINNNLNKSYHDNYATGPIGSWSRPILVNRESVNSHFGAIGYPYLADLNPDNDTTIPDTMCVSAICVGDNMIPNHDYSACIRRRVTCNELSTVYGIGAAKNMSCNVSNTNIPEDVDGTDPVWQYLLSSENTFKPKSYCNYICTEKGWVVRVRDDSCADGYTPSYNMRACLSHTEIAEKLCTKTGGGFDKGKCKCPGQLVVKKGDEYDYCDNKKNSTVNLSDTLRAVQDELMGINGNILGNTTSNSADDADGAAADTISALAKTLDAIEDAYGLSKWRTVDGKFNYARLASDATAAVVLGTTGALVTSSVVKKKQVEAGFESLECTVGGQHVGDWGDVFRIDGK